MQTCHGCGDLIYPPRRPDPAGRPWCGVCLEVTVRSGDEAGSGVMLAEFVGGPLDGHRDERPTRTHAIFQSPPPGSPGGVYHRTGRITKGGRVAFVWIGWLTPVDPAAARSSR